MFLFYLFGRISTDLYALYIKACAEKHVIEALENHQKLEVVVPDEVATSLAVLTALEKCPGPNCSIPFEHNGKYNANIKVYTISCNAGGCTAMYCRTCKSHYCFWCRSVIKSVDAHMNDSDAVHRHVFDCEKRPAPAQILTSSALFPVGNLAAEDYSDFMHAFLLTQRLETLACQMKTGWSSERCKRLVLNQQFQELLVGLRGTQTKYRAMHPEKPNLLRFHFHKVRLFVRCVYSVHSPIPCR